jgi:hypothetical protein
MFTVAPITLSIDKMAVFDVFSCCLIDEGMFAFVTYILDFCGMISHIGRPSETIPGEISLYFDRWRCKGDFRIVQ